MMKQTNLFEVVSFVLSFALSACSTLSGDFDSESHFACSADRDCSGQSGRSACMGGRCVLPELYTDDAGAGGPSMRPPIASSAGGASGERWDSSNSSDPKLTVIADGGEEGLYALAVDATHVYWLDSGMLLPPAAVRRVPRNGGEIETLHTNEGVSYTIALDEHNVYVAYEARGYPKDGVVVAIPKGGGTPVELVKSVNPTKITVVRGWLYYKNFDNEGNGGSSIWRIPVAGGTPESVVVEVDNAWDFASDGDYLYYSEMNQGRILRVAVTGGAPVTLAEGWLGTSSLALDGDDVVFAACYVGSCEPSHLYRVPRAGGATTLVLSAKSYDSGPIASSSWVLVWGHLVIPADGKPLALFPDAPERVGTGVSVDSGAVFIGDFFTSRVYRYEPTNGVR